MEHSFQRISEKDLNIYFENVNKKATSITKITPILNKKSIGNQKEQYQPQDYTSNDRQFTSLNDILLGYEDKLLLVVNQITLAGHINGNKLLKQFNKWNNNLRVHFCQLTNYFQKIGFDQINYTLQQVTSRLLKVQSVLLNKTLQLLNSSHTPYQTSNSPISSHNTSKANLCQQCGLNVEMVYLQNLQKKTTMCSEKVGVSITTSQLKQQIGKLEQGQFMTKERDDYLEALEEALSRKNNFIIKKQGQTYEYLANYLSDLQEQSADRLKKANGRAHYHNPSSVFNAIDNLQSTQSIYNRFISCQDIKNDIDLENIGKMNSTTRQSLNRIIKKVVYLVATKLKDQLKPIKTTHQTQTNLLETNQQLKNMEKTYERIQNQLAMLKNSKRQLEKQTINGIQIIQKQSNKISELTSKNKSLIIEVQEVKSGQKITQETLNQTLRLHQQQVQNLIALTLEEKQTNLKRIKQLQKSSKHLAEVNEKNQQSQTQTIQKCHCQIQVLMEQVFEHNSSGLKQRLSRKISNTNLAISSRNLHDIQPEKRRLKGIKTSTKNIKDDQNQFQKQNISDELSEQNIGTKDITDHQTLTQKVAFSRDLENKADPSMLKVNIMFTQDVSSRTVKSTKNNSLSYQSSLQVQKEQWRKRMTRKKSSIGEIQMEDDQRGREYLQSDLILSNRNTEDDSNKLGTNPNNKLEIFEGSSNLLSPSLTSGQLPIYKKKHQNHGGKPGSTDFKTSTKKLRQSKKTQAYRKSKLQKFLQNNFDHSVYSACQHTLMPTQKEKLIRAIQQNYEHFMRIGVIQMLQSFTEQRQTNQQIPINSRNGFQIQSDYTINEQVAKRGTSNQHLRPQMHRKGRNPSRIQIPAPIEEYTKPYYLEKTTLSSIPVSSLNSSNHAIFFGISSISTTQSPRGLGSSLENKLINRIRANHALASNTPLSKQDLLLFGGQQEALKYEKTEGYWNPLNTVLGIDNDCMKDADNIDKFFKFLKQLNSSLFQQYYRFLKHPYTFITALATNQSTQNCGLSRIGGDNSVVSKIPKLSKKDNNFIRDLFRKLLRMHKTIHKNCRHIDVFLGKIGCYRYYCKYAQK